jgi:hypothetical protein
MTTVSDGGRLRLVAALACLVMGGGARAPAAERDTAPDTWVATDALGRTLPDAAAVGAPRDRSVLMFYFLWLGAHNAVGEGPFDNTRILAGAPGAMTQTGSPPWGPPNTYHHWGEPLFGYYASDDPWVLRKHAQMLADAGVDGVVFDVTNGPTYPGAAKALIETFAAVRAQGGKTPAICFLCPFGGAPVVPVVEQLLKDIYEPRLHPELWYRWRGKPLLLVDPSNLPFPPERMAALRERFTFRATQPDYFRGPTKPDQWGWLEVHPQHAFRDAAGVTEEVTVGVAQNAVAGGLGSMSQPGAQGRSFHAGALDPRPQAEPMGLNFAEQWTRARELDPQAVFVTGWNEWIASRLPEFNGYRAPNVFVDEFDLEHSRDLEPMRGGHGDAYYYQLVAEVRRFKGARPAPVAGPPHVIDPGAGPAAWADVQPEYRDDLGDVAHRDHAGYNHVQRYADDTGRNDIISCKVAYDRTRVWFQVRTAAPVGAAQDHDWMTLLIDADRDHATGWEGYDYAINRQGRGGKTASVERCRGPGWAWEAIGQAPLTIQGDQVVVGVPRALLGLPDGAAAPAFDFKWCDNATGSGDIQDFLTHGDVAPNGRFNYRFGPAR